MFGIKEKTWRKQEFQVFFWQKKIFKTHVRDNKQYEKAMQKW